MSTQYSSCTGLRTAQSADHHTIFRGMGCLHDSMGAARRSPGPQASVSRIFILLSPCNARMTAIRKRGRATTEYFRCLSISCELAKKGICKQSNALYRTYEDVEAHLCGGMSPATTIFRNPHVNRPSSSSVSLFGSHHHQWHLQQLMYPRNSHDHGCKPE